MSIMDLKYRLAIILPWQMREGLDFISVLQRMGLPEETTHYSVSSMEATATLSPAD